jgi:NADH-quinone oxidoreductase subunit N
MQQYLALSPEALLAVAALVVLFAELYGGDRMAAVVGSVAAAVATALIWIFPAPPEMLGGMLDFGTGAATATVRSSITGLTALLLIWVVARGWGGEKAREGVSLVLFATVGGMLLVSASDLVMLFMAIELATLPSYVLIGYARNDRLGLEGALKYFLFSMLTSLILAYGPSFVFGLSGTTAYTPLPASAGALGLFSGLLIAAGFLAKVTAVPFHFWSPDAYEGSSPTSVAYVSAIAKIGPMWAFARFFGEVMPGVEGLLFAVLIASVASMLVGNFVALVQSDTRRLVAYSGIANVGYMLLGIASGSSAGMASAVFYVVVYAVGVLGLMLVIAQEGPGMADIAGLVRRRPYAAWSSVGFLFSIIGFPPLVGFFGKFAVFSAAYNAGYLWAVVVGILTSVVAAGYAFNILRAMFTPGESAPEEIIRPSMEESSAYRQHPVLAASIILALALTVVGLGLIADPLVRMLDVGLL